MSFVIAAPEMVQSAAADLAGIGSTIAAATTAAAAPTTGVLAAAADEVSKAVAALLGAHGAEYQAISAQVADLHGDFVRAVAAGGASYSLAEAANASPLQTLEQDLLGAVNAPTQALLGRPLIGNGANGTTVAGMGQPGGPGGLLYGDGGNGGPSTLAGVPGGAGGAGGLFGNGGAGGTGGAGATGGAG
ncbi:PE family protein, partial [Mycobacterium sp. 852002-50816_SCH5313054-b]|uniref:PE family protein n=1 Tax=Mycobacterium sp. 852002-50816_SCH5313054-b TaxID=1834092 RepID=UPI000AE3DDCF